MSQDRWDPEMRAFTAMMEERGRAFPPIVLVPPLDAARASNDGPGLALAAAGGPTMAESGDKWLSVRGRRLACRVHRPRTDKPLPYVQVVDNGRIAHRTVQMGARGQVDGEQWVAVQGVAEGAQVLRGASGVLREGTQVKLIVPTAPASAARNGVRP